MPNPLLDAIKKDDYSEVLLILNQNPLNNSAILNQEYNYKEGLVEQEVSAIPLHLATALLSPQLVELMLKRGADPNIRSTHLDYTPLDLVTGCKNICNPVAVSKKLQIIDLLFYYGAAINDGITEKCISVSVELGHARANPEFWHNNQIVMALAYHKTLNNFLCLVRQGKCQEAVKALDKTHIVKHPYTNRTLCAFKLNPNSDGGTYGNAVLYAAELENSNMLQLLFDRGADLTVVDLMKNNAFHYAARAGRTENIEWLAQHLPKDICGHLISAGNKIHKNTPLHFAAKYNRPHIVEKLLSLGSSKKNMNLQEKTAEELKVTNEVKEIFNMYPDGVPTLLWLALKTCVQNKMLLPDVYFPKIDEHYKNLSKTRDKRSSSI